MEIKYKSFIADFLILIISSIWGFSFVFQKIVSDLIPAAFFNSVRYFLGSFFVLLVFFIVSAIKKFPPIQNVKKTFLAGLIVGFFLFGGSIGQQVGAIWTTASNAGFITGFYVLLVPIFSIFLKVEKPNLTLFISALIVLIGLFFLTNTELNINKGDFIIMLSAFFWAWQIISIDHFSKKFNILLLAFFTFFSCAVLSLIFSLLTETIVVTDLKTVAFPLFFLAIISTGGAYLLQFFCQKHTYPSHASLIFSTESIFSLIGGIFILNEKISFNLIFGGSLIVLGIVISSFRHYKKSY